MPQKYKLVLMPDSTEPQSGWVSQTTLTEGTYIVSCYGYWSRDMPDKSFSGGTDEFSLTIPKDGS